MFFNPEGCFIWQASLDSVLEQDGGVTGFISLCREILTRFIDQNFPTKLVPTVSRSAYTLFTTQ